MHFNDSKKLTRGREAGDAGFRTDGLRNLNL